MPSAIGGGDRSRRGAPRARRPLPPQCPRAPPRRRRSTVATPIVGRSMRRSWIGLGRFTSTPRRASGVPRNARRQVADAAQHRVGALLRFDGKHQAVAHHHALADVEGADGGGDARGLGDVRALRGVWRKRAPRARRREQVAPSPPRRRRRGSRRARARPAARAATRHRPAAQRPAAREPWQGRRRRDRACADPGAAPCRACTMASQPASRIASHARAHGAEAMRRRRDAHRAPRRRSRAMRATK